MVSQQQVTGQLLLQPLAMRMCDELFCFVDTFDRAGASCSASTAMAVPIFLKIRRLPSLSLHGIILWLNLPLGPIILSLRTFIPLNAHQLRPSLKPHTPIILHGAACANVVYQFSCKCSCDQIIIDVGL